MKFTHILLGSSSREKENVLLFMGAKNIRDKYTEHLWKCLWEAIQHNSHIFQVNLSSVVSVWWTNAASVRCQLKMWNSCLTYMPLWRMRNSWLAVTHEVIGRLSCWVRMINCIIRKHCFIQLRLFCTVGNRFYGSFVHHKRTTLLKTILCVPVRIDHPFLDINISCL